MAAFKKMLMSAGWMNLRGWWTAATDCKQKNECPAEQVHHQCLQHDPDTGGTASLVAQDSSVRIPGGDTAHMIIVSRLISILTHDMVF